MTNFEFGRRVNCHHSMASRIRSGHRLPGVDLLTRISAEFKIPVTTLLKARVADLELQERGERMHHVADLLDKRVKVKIDASQAA
jgi:transcriptional regulator with XRE-family HTH domain